VQLTDATISKIKQASVLAPLHNPPGLQGIEAAMKVFGGVPQVKTVLHTLYCSPSAAATLQYSVACTCCCRQACLHTPAYFGCTLQQPLYSTNHIHRKQ